MPQQTKIVTNEWTIRIVDRLRHGPLGFNALDRAIEIPNPMMLSRHLKKLIRDGIVERRVHTLGPPAKTEYSLTELGRDLSVPASAMIRWLSTNTGHIEAARAHAKSLAIETAAE